MLFIVAAHVALVAVVMSAKMDLPDPMFRKPIKIELIAPPTLPPERSLEQHPTRQQPQPREMSQPRQRELEVPLVHTPIGSSDSTPKLPDFADLIGPGTQPQPRIDPRPTPNVAPTPARLLTAASDLKPPYPESKILTGEEAVLTLRLTINEQGRVIAVEPVGRADRTFLEAAKRHLMARWRYKPATEGGRAVSSVLTLTLRFQLD